MKFYTYVKKYKYEKEKLNHMLFYMYDLIIVGGGISGLYLYYKLIHKSKKILLLEKNAVFGGRIYQHNEKVNNTELSFPAGAARFNKNHIRVIQLLKEFGLLDFRKDKGWPASIDFIDSKNKFSSKFDNKTGFDYIKIVLKHANEIPDNELKQKTFQEFALEVLKKEEVDFLLVASGYSGQLKHMNMYDAYFLFKNGIRADMNYFSGYYHLLIEDLVKYLQKHNAQLKNNMEVQSIEQNSEKNHYEIYGNKKKYNAKKIALCVPQESLLQFPFLNPIKKVLKNTIQCKSLCRTYALFNKNDIWFKDLEKKVITNNPLRFIIPMDNEKGLIMISYTDDIYTNFWKDKNEDEVKIAIVKYVKETFGLTINPPEKTWVFYWNSGVAYWKKGINSETVSKFINNPMPNVYICGENYSLNQSWVEGALETCDSCLKEMNI